MKSWNGAVNSVVAAIARSTCSSPRTSRRVRTPAAVRSSSFTDLVSFALSVSGQGAADKFGARAEIAGRVNGRLQLCASDPGRGERAGRQRIGEQRVGEARARFRGVRRRRDQVMGGQP